jgi:hypothetical protein
MLQAAKLMPQIAWWRRQMLISGVLIAIAGGLWVAAAGCGAFFRGSPEQIFFSLLGPHLWSASLLLYQANGRAMQAVILILATLAIAFFSVGLWGLTRVHPKAPKSRWRALFMILLRVIIAINLAAACGLALLYTGVFFSSPSFQFYELRDQILPWAGRLDAAELAAAGPYLGWIAVCAGRRGLGARIAALFIVAAMVTDALGEIPKSGLWQLHPWFLGPCLLILYAALSTATWLLLIRFGGMTFWNRDRWWAWAGYTTDPDATRPV